MRYRVLDLPPGQPGAFTPLMATNPIASSWGLVNVTANMGRVPVPVPAPTRVWAPGMSADPATQSSNVAPDFILPSKYIAHADNMHPPVPIRNRNDMPVPARSWIVTTMSAMVSRKTGTRTTVPWPRSFQRWNSSGSGGQSG